MARSRRKAKQKEVLSEEEERAIVQEIDHLKHQTKAAEADLFKSIFLTRLTVMRFVAPRQARIKALMALLGHRAKGVS